jgi:hypothetical protein
MKTVRLFAVLAIAVCLIGCENAELIDCQQDKDILQGQVDQATAAITERHPARPGGPGDCRDHRKRCQN